MSIQTLRQVISDANISKLNQEAKKIVRTPKESSVRICFLALEVLSKITLHLSIDDQCKVKQEMKEKFFTRISTFLEKLCPNFLETIKQVFNKEVQVTHSEKPTWPQEISNFLQLSTTEDFCRDIGRCELDVFRHNKLMSKSICSLKQLQSYVLSIFSLGFFYFEHHAINNHQIIAMEHFICSFVSEVFQTVQLSIDQYNKAETVLTDLQKEGMNRGLTFEQVTVLDFEDKFQEAQKLQIPPVEYFNLHLTLPKREALLLGVPLSDIRENDWLRSVHIEAMKSGLTYEDIKELNSIQVKGMLRCRLSRHQVEGNWYQRPHFFLGKRGVPYEQYVRLDYWSAQAMNERLIISREQIDEIQFTEYHYTALRNGLSCQDLKDLNPEEIQHLMLDHSEGLDEETLRKEAKKLGISEDKYLALTRFQQLGMRDLGLSYDQVEPKEGPRWFARDHYIAGRQGVLYEQYKGLKYIQARALAEKLVRNKEEVSYKEFSQVHLEALRQGRHPSEIKGLGPVKVEIMLLANVNREQIDNAIASGGLQLPHLQAARKGHKFEDYSMLSPWEARALAQGVSLEDISLFEGDLSKTDVYNDFVRRKKK